MKPDEKLIKTYEETDYIILPLDLIVHIGIENRRLLFEMEKSEWHSFSIITAWNPYSDVIPHEENLIRNLKLLKDLVEDDYFIYPALGKARDNFWKPEESWCVFNISKEKALFYGQKYEQNAVVFGTQKSLPELVFCV